MLLHTRVSVVVAQELDLDAVALGFDPLGPMSTKDFAPSNSRSEVDRLRQKLDDAEAEIDALRTAAACVGGIVAVQALHRKEAEV